MAQHDISRNESRPKKDKKKANTSANTLMPNSADESQTSEGKNGKDARSKKDLASSNVPREDSDTEREYNSRSRSRARQGSDSDREQNSRQKNKSSQSRGNTSKRRAKGDSRRDKR